MSKPEIDWPIIFTLRNGVSIDGTFTSEHNNSGDVIDEIFNLVNSSTGAVKWISIRRSPSSSVSIRFDSVEAIELKLPSTKHMKG